MKLIKIDNYYIIVSDEEIPYNPNGGTDGNFFCMSEVLSNIEHGVKKGDKQYVSPFVKNVGNCKSCRRIITSQNPEHNLPTITFSDEVAKELGIVINLGKQKAEDSWTPCDGCDENNEYFWKNGFRNGYNSGYNQALSDNKDKLFSEKEALELAFDAFVAGRRLLKRVSDEDDFKSMFLTSLTDNNIQYLTKQEWEVELEMEEKCCGLLGSTVKNSELTETCNYCSVRGNLQPKISNNSVKVIKIIK